jgi:thiol-disulfide isomerase/thioredoxin
MSYKYLIILPLFIGPIFSQAQTKPQRVFLSGTIKNANNSITIIDQCALGQLMPLNDQRQLIPDSNGHFSISFPLEKAGYFIIGRNTVYLSPGDKMTAFIDYREPLNAKFKGSHSALNDYLKATPFLKSGSYLDGGLNIKSTVPLTIEMIIKEGAKRKELLLSKKFPTRITKLETMRINNDLVNSLNKIWMYYPLVHKIQRDSIDIFKAACNKIVLPYMSRYGLAPLNADYLNVPGYFDLAFDKMAKGDSMSKAALQINDWASAFNLSSDLKRAHDRPAIMALRIEIFKITNAKYRALLIGIYNKKIKFNNGDLAIDFNAENIDGQKVNIANYKGKVIFIDVWATWCGPCLQEMPHFKELAEKYKNNQQIIFISLSIDVDRDIWKNKVRRTPIEMLEWNTSSSAMSMYSVTTIPKTIIIDKNFKVVDMSGPLPSSPEIRKYIDAILSGNK